MGACESRLERVPGEQSRQLSYHNTGSHELLSQAVLAAPGTWKDDICKVTVLSGNITWGSKIFRPGL